VPAWSLQCTRQGIDDLTKRVDVGALLVVPGRLIGRSTERASGFPDRRLADLVNDTLALGIARSGGQAPFVELMGKAFGTTRLLLAGYVQLAGHVNNLALSDWMPTSSRTSPKVHALVQLHARSP